MARTGGHEPQAPGHAEIGVEIFGQAQGAGLLPERSPPARRTDPGQPDQLPAAIVEFVEQTRPTTEGSVGDPRLTDLAVGRHVSDEIAAGQTINVGPVQPPSRQHHRVELRGTEAIGQRDPRQPRTQCFIWLKGRRRDARLSENTIPDPPF